MIPLSNEKDEIGAFVGAAFVNVDGRVVCDSEVILVE